MARITRGDFLQRIVDELGIQPGADNAPRDIANTIVATIPVQRTPSFHQNIALDDISSTTGAVVVKTTRTDRDFFMTNASIAVTSDVSSDNVAANINAFVNGVGINVIRIVSQTLTAGSDHIELTFNPPLLVDRGTNIILTGTFTVGATTKTSFVSGFEVLDK